MRYLAHSLVTIVCAGVGSASFADPTSAIMATKDRYIELCNTVMANPAAFVDNLATFYAPGTFGAVATPDGQHFKVNASAGNGKFFDTYSRTLLVNRGSEGCGTYATGGVQGESKVIATIVENHLAQTYGAESYTGGYFPELYSEWGDTSDKVVINPGNYEYIVANMLTDPKLDTLIQVTDNFVSFTTFRDLAANEN